VLLLLKVAFELFPTERIVPKESFFLGMERATKFQSTKRKSANEKKKKDRLIRAAVAVIFSIELV
jgi:hypothetical protein